MNNGAAACQVGYGDLTVASSRGTRIFLAFYVLLCLLLVRCSRLRAGKMQRKVVMTKA